jgi:hypothetical protein
MPTHPTPADQPSRNASRIKILNWPNAKKEESIDDKMPLVRYMKLETFLLLLDNRLFIPTLKLLQGGDRLESRIPEKLCPNYWKKMQPIVADRDHEQWLLRMARRPKIFRKEGSRLMADPKLLTEIWLEELAKRRCVWCWNRSTEQIYAMWKLYGDRGVAVLSTVGSVRRALADAGAHGIVSSLWYVGRPGPTRLEDNGVMSALESLRRPYLFKDAGYRIEEEVRFVLGTNPVATNKSQGAMTNIEAKAIIGKTFKISPELPLEEQTSIQKIATERLNARKTG